MRAPSVPALLIAGVFLIPAGSSAQSLAEIAAKEKEKKKGKPAKVYTEDDLARSGRSRGYNPPPGTGAAEAPAAEASPAAAEEGAPREKSEDEIRAEKEKAWREKLQQTREDVTRLTGDVDRLQTALNDVSANLYGPGRASRVAELEKLKQQLEQAKQTAADLEEEGRRNRFRE